MNINTKKIQKLWKRSIFGDFDGDGVMNAFDCKPKNKRKQDSDVKFSDETWERLGKIAEKELASGKVTGEAADELEKEFNKRGIYF